MSYDFRITKAGYNALTETDPNKYIFHSAYNTFKILKEATDSISYTTNGAYNKNHNLSLSNPAAFLVFMKFPDGYTAMLNGTFGGVSRNRTFSALVGITTTQLKFIIFGDGASHTINYKYYIFETPLS